MQWSGNPISLQWSYIRDHFIWSWIHSQIIVESTPKYWFESFFWEWIPLFWEWIPLFWAWISTPKRSDPYITMTPKRVDFHSCTFRKYCQRVGGGGEGVGGWGILQDEVRSPHAFPGESLLLDAIWVPYIDSHAAKVDSDLFCNYVCDVIHLRILVISKTADKRSFVVKEWCTEHSSFPLHDIRVWLELSQ